MVEMGQNNFKFTPAVNDDIAINVGGGANTCVEAERVVCSAGIAEKRAAC